VLIGRLAWRRLEPARAAAAEPGEGSVHARGGKSAGL
jgi:hypothetical protein